jgi:hypothetical protein
LKVCENFGTRTKKYSKITGPKFGENFHPKIAKLFEKSFTRGPRK